MSVCLNVVAYSCIAVAIRLLHLFFFFLFLFLGGGGGAPPPGKKRKSLRGGGGKIEACGSVREEEDFKGKICLRKKGCAVCTTTRP